MPAGARVERVERGLKLRGQGLRSGRVRAFGRNGGRGRRKVMDRCREKLTKAIRFLNIFLTLSAAMHHDSQRILVYLDATKVLCSGPWFDRLCMLEGLLSS
jgi:hypothetical protein